MASASSSAPAVIHDLFVANVPRDITVQAFEAFIERRAPGLGRFMAAVNHGGKEGVSTTFAFVAYENPARGLDAIPLLNGARLDDTVNDARPLQCRLNHEPPNPYTFSSRRGPEWGPGSRFYLPERPRPSRCDEAQQDNDRLREQLFQQAWEFPNLKLQRDKLLEVVGSASVDSACSNCDRLLREGNQLLDDYEAMRESRDSLQRKGDALYAEYEKLRNQLAVRNKPNVLAVHGSKRESVVDAAVDRLRLENDRLRSQVDERDHQLDRASARAQQQDRELSEANARNAQLVADNEKLTKRVQRMNERVTRCGQCSALLYGHEFVAHQKI